MYIVPGKSKTLPLAGLEVVCIPSAERGSNTARVWVSIPGFDQRVEQGINTGWVRGAIPCVVQKVEQGIYTGRVRGAVPWVQRRGEQ